MESRPRQACDGCRFRKTKCDRQHPCSTCIRASLKCQYLHTIRQKGPRRGQGRRLARLRAAPDGVAEADTFEISTLTMFSKAFDDRKPTDSKATEPVPRPLTGLSLSTEAAGQSCAVLAAHIQLFVKYLFPIMPVIDTGEILADVYRLDELAPSRYALIMSICATTRMQFNLDTMTTSRWSLDIPQEPKVNTEMLIKAAESARRQLNLVDDVTVDSVATSYFLFTTYASLEKLRHAWLYLNQSITLATLLGIDDETGHCVLSNHDSIIGRRMFWILFVTERYVCPATFVTHISPNLE